MQGDAVRATTRAQGVTLVASSSLPNVACGNAAASELSSLQLSYRWTVRDVTLAGRAVAASDFATNDPKKLVVAPAGSGGGGGGGGGGVTLRARHTYEIEHRDIVMRRLHPSVEEPQS